MHIPARLDSRHELPGDSTRFELRCICHYGTAVRSGRDLVLVVLLLLLHPSSRGRCASIARSRRHTRLGPPELNPFILGNQRGNGHAEQSLGSCRNEAFRRVVHINGRASLCAFGLFLTALTPMKRLQDTTPPVDLAARSMTRQTSFTAGRAPQ